MASTYYTASKIQIFPTVTLSALSQVGKSKDFSHEYQMCVYYGMHVNDFGHPSLMNNRHITYTFPSAGFLCLYSAMHKNEWHVMHERFLIPASLLKKRQRAFLLLEKKTECNSKFFKSLFQVA